LTTLLKDQLLVLVWGAVYCGVLEQSEFFYSHVYSQYFEKKTILRLLLEFNGNEL